MKHYKHLERLFKCCCSLEVRHKRSLYDQSVLFRHTPEDGSLLGIRVNAAKCVFLQNSVEYLGHVIDADGLHTSSKKVKAIQDAPTPPNPQELSGLLHYYGKFIPNLAIILLQLNELLKKGSTWKWSKECAKQAKTQLSSTLLFKLITILSFH